VPSSWEAGGYSQGLSDAIARAQAAGNDGANNDSILSDPSGYALSNVIAVASITSTGTLSSFSNYGASTVHIGAPGSGIWSTVPKSSKGKVVAGYASYNGTSMATPPVTGAVALYKARHATATGGDIRTAILNGTPILMLLLWKVPLSFSLGTGILKNWHD
jgi:subtilisin family serine protease